MYRVKLRAIGDGLGLLISDRDVARLCLGDGDELVIAEVVRRPAVDSGLPAPSPSLRAPRESPLFTAEQPPAQVNGAHAAAGSPPEAAPTLAEHPEQTERDKSAFRRLAR
ncbi:hypothetical protein LNKW23_24060 [Paralimibaculum aggregatum]|uniref:SpoVT-AbrB domain-containing protein n=1 Tax=Paralimibaculum aggregatum TaxID=3036245 RepID=A0ABQ6LIT3_9RHOB|nr:hypothetical protein [Limibaculum sp. NKW23]GMG83193.1 hypothetical protein LNKW23_24060 [Limibaculum sp. NKW23]